MHPIAFILAATSLLAFPAPEPLHPTTKTAALYCSSSAPVCVMNCVEGKVCKVFPETPISCAVAKCIDKVDALQEKQEKDVNAPKSCPGIVLSCEGVQCKAGYKCQVIPATPFSCGTIACDKH